MTDLSDKYNALMLEKGSPYSGIATFAKLPFSRDLKDVAVAIIGIPFDLATTHRPGARFGPKSIRGMSIFGAKYFSYGMAVWPWEFKPLENNKIIDFGDINYAVGSQSSMIEEVEAHIGNILDAGIKPLSLGGDHFITYPILKAFSKKFKTLSLLHFDSHADCLPMEPKNHGTMFHFAATEGIVDPTRSVQLGLRTDYSSSLNYNVINANEILDLGPEMTAKKVKSIVGDNPIYLTFDIDFLDPAFAPATGTPEIGGPSTNFARRLLKNLSGLNIVGADLVEVAPAYEGSSEITALAGAQLAVDIIHLLTVPNTNHH